MWEAALIREVVAYIKTLTKRVTPTGCVYVAVDGVAPMAKIRQQRARRFKSAAMAAEEASARGQTQGVERWDSNAITPGTQFMAQLAIALHDIKQINQVPVIVSAADEAGEGEQKIMAWLRETKWRDVVVYGLDADLIVLALLEHARSGRTVDLFREETEFGGAVKRDATGEEQYLYLHAEHLATALHAAWSAPGRPKADFLMDFVGAMNLLGNDFVPHGMGLKIHDQGIERVLGILRGFQTPLVAAPGADTPTATYNRPTLAALLSVLEAGEEAAVLRGAKKKLEARVGATAAKDEVSRALARLNDRPVEWAAEKVLVESVAIAGHEKPQWVMRSAWREAYYKHGLAGAVPADAARAYIQTLSWTLNYYCGTPVATTWYYPWLLPPLLRDVVACLDVEQPPAAAPCITNRPLQPLEQLAMVLPRTSFHLLPRELQTLPTRYPFAWPERWDYFSLGRRFLWECEPLIPLVQPAQIQRWVDECL